MTRLWMIPAATVMLAGSAIAFAASAAPSLPASETLKLATSSTEAGVQKAHYRRYWHYRRHHHHYWRYHHHHRRHHHWW